MGIRNETPASKTQGQCQDLTASNLEMKFNRCSKWRQVEKASRDSNTYSFQLQSLPLVDGASCLNIHSTASSFCCPKATSHRTSFAAFPASWWCHLVVTRIRLILAWLNPKRTPYRRAQVRFLPQILDRDSDDAEFLSSTMAFLLSL